MTMLEIMGWKNPTADGSDVENKSQVSDVTVNGTLTF